MKLTTKKLPNICRTYKGSKIDWDDDECAAPLEKPQVTRRDNVQPKKKDAPVMNRFQLLNMDSAEDSEDEETSALAFQTALLPSTLGVVA